MALPSSDQCFSSSLSFTGCLSLLVSSHRKVSFFWNPMVLGKKGIYSLLRFPESWQLPHRLLRALELVPTVKPILGCFLPDNVSSKRFFRDCSNGPAIHCEMVLNEIAFLWQLYSKSEKRMKYQMKIIFSGCTLWKTLLGNEYHRKLTYQVLKYSLGCVACYEPVLFLESCQSTMTLSEGKNHSHSLL